MSVGKIQYKELLKDENLTPTKLKDLYTSMLKKEASFENYNKNWALDPEERYTIMTPEAAAAVIASRQEAAKSENRWERILDALEEPTEESTENPTESIEISEDPETENTSFTPIQGGIWPMTVDSETYSGLAVDQSSPVTFSDNRDFARKMLNAYTEELTKRGYNPAFAEYLVAQDANESGWGQHRAGKNNFGGIKGEGNVTKTKEWDGEKYVEEMSSFRNFNSLQDYIKFKIDLLEKNYDVFSYSPERYFERVKAGGYATDPNYVSNLTAVLKTVRKYLQ